MKSVCIITPTIGSDHLMQCVKSVKEQTYKNIRHLVVIDGQDANQNYVKDHNCTLVTELHCHLIHPLILHYNVGANGWYGHRIYAAFSYLVNEDYIIYLDEDNFLEPNHVESLIITLQKSNAYWAYSLRNIVNKEGEFICRDNCESLGLWPSVGEYNHVDTSCFFIPTKIAVKACHAWYNQWGADRQFFKELNKIGSTIPSMEYTLNYRLDGNPGSPKKEFFLQGNEIMKQMYAKYGFSNLPWENGYEQV